MNILGQSVLKEQFSLSTVRKVAFYIGVKIKFQHCM